MTGLINSAEIQAVVRPAGEKIAKRPWTQRKNPLVNRGVLFRLNPYAKTIRRQELLKAERIAKGTRRHRRSRRARRPRRSLRLSSLSMRLSLQNASSLARMYDYMFFPPMLLFSI